MKVCRYEDNSAEIAVHVDYYDDDPATVDDLTPIHHEEATFPAGTPASKILERFGYLGRSERLLRGRAKPSEPSLLGDVFAIDDV